MKAGRRTLFYKTLMNKLIDASKLITEIKIGNRLYSLIDRDGQTERRPVRVTGIRTDGGDLIQGDDTDAWYPIETYEPIPITSEILEKNRIQLHVGPGGLHQGNIHGINCEINFNIIRFVHELQNALSLCQIDKDILL